MPKLNISLAQMNIALGDVARNFRRMQDWSAEAARRLVQMPEPQVEEGMGQHVDPLRHLPVAGGMSVDAPGLIDNGPAFGGTEPSLAAADEDAMAEWPEQRVLGDEEVRRLESPGGLVPIGRPLGGPGFTRHLCAPPTAVGRGRRRP